jgi:peptidoglycan hydrolase-like protein with peptidoglycan-binding domain
VQESLNLLGYNVGDVDGIIGDGTRRVIQQYQADIGIKTDGKAGKKIHQRLIISSADLKKAASTNLNIDADAKNTIADPSLSLEQEKIKTQSKYSLSNFTRYKTFAAVFIGLLALIMAAALVLITRKR